MKIKGLLLAAAVACVCSCASHSTDQDPLPSWNDTPVKQQLLSYIQHDIEQIPVEDRIAVFDMDGTIACERPLGLEMVVSIHRILEKGQTDPALRETLEYQFAEKLAVNPRDTSVLNHCYVNGKNFMDNITMKATEGMENEDYVHYAKEYLTSHNDKKFNIRYADMFYQPMLELIDLLHQKQFEVYIVSGSMQGLVWSVCPQQTGLNREHLIGTYQAMKVSFPKEGPVSYIIQDSILKPKNNYYGKAINIYNHIGKIPVMAVGNTLGDFGMFHMVSCSKYPHLALMLNHDDDKREFEYLPYRNGQPDWQDSLRTNGWLQADMTREFKTVWKKK